MELPSSVNRFFFKDFSLFFTNAMIQLLIEKQTYIGIFKDNLVKNV